MRYWLLGTLAMATVLGGCGGSVTKDGDGTGGSGTGGAPGTGAVAGTGGYAGTGAVAGGGSAGTAGGGGWAGTAGGGGWAGTAGGGSAGTAGGGGVPACCGSDDDCPQFYDTGLTTECIAGVCKEIPQLGQCWDDADCFGSQCVGGSVCPCGADCFAADTLGWCTSKPPPPPPGCCVTDIDCGDYAWMPCVSGVCKMPAGGGLCWVDAECPMGQKCIGASVCPCGAPCAMVDTPGKCG
jgi:hypothetical protein